MIAKFWLNKYNHLDYYLLNSWKARHVSVFLRKNRRRVHWQSKKGGAFTSKVVSQEWKPHVDTIPRNLLRIRCRKITWCSRELKSLRSWWMRKSDRVTSGWLQHSQRGMSGKVCQELLETIRPFQWHVQACPPFR